MATIQSFLLLLVLPFLSTPGQAAEEAFPEHRVKAAMLYYFAQYTIWPTNTFSSNTDPIVIGILGEDPFGPMLPAMLKGKSIGGRALITRAKQYGDNLNDCHLLFVSRSEKGRLSGILSTLRGKPILTISELDRFARTGGMLQFVLIDDKVRFQINPQAIEHSGLRVSATLGALGIVVKPDPRDL